MSSTAWTHVITAFSAGALAFAISTVRDTEGSQSAAVATLPLSPTEICGGASAAQLRTTLYFGTNRPSGSVSELEWQLFVRDEVTTRFPEGLTVWEALGQWRDPGGTIAQERSKVLLLVHADSDKARAAVQDVIARYRRLFEQQSVLWETARVCVAS